MSRPRKRKEAYRLRRYEHKLERRIRRGIAPECPMCGSPRQHTHEI